MLPSLAQLSIGVEKHTRGDDVNSQQQEMPNVKIILQDLPDQLIELVLFALNTQNCKLLSTLERVSHDFARIYRDPNFWNVVIESFKWMVNWNTGLSPKEYFRMVCQMKDEHREMLLEITSETKKIQDLTFYGCESLALTSLPHDLKYIGMAAFYGCKSLALTSLPHDLKYIGMAVFHGCKSLTLTSLPDGLKYISKSAFYGCESLALATLPDGLNYIEEKGFEGCTSLALTSLPDDLKYIGKSAFSGCKSLALTSLPEGLSGIGDFAFSGCKFLNEDMIKTITSFNTHALSDTGLFNTEDSSDSDSDSD